MEGQPHKITQDNGNIKKYMGGQQPHKITTVGSQLSEQVGTEGCLDI